LLEERSLIIDKTKRIQTKITLTKYNDSSKDINQDNIETLEVRN
jgi:hypothetical protein